MEVFLKGEASEGSFDKMQGLELSVLCWCRKIINNRIVCWSAVIVPTPKSLPHFSHSLTRLSFLYLLELDQEKNKQNSTPVASAGMPLPLTRLVPCITNLHSWNNPKNVLQIWRPCCQVADAKEQRSFLSYRENRKHCQKTWISICADDWVRIWHQLHESTDPTWQLLRLMVGLY